MKYVMRFFKRHSLLIALLLIFASGTIFRLWGVSSVYERVDDIPVAKHIEKIYHGDWRPDPVFYYPIFFNYIAAVILRGLSGFLSLIGVHGGSGLFEFSFDQILLAARLLSALMGSLTILFVYAIGRRLYSRGEALLASFFFSVSFIHICYSHQIVLDVPMTFFYALALLFCARLLEIRRWWDYALAGFICGIAVATKYNGLFILAALFLAHLLGFPAVKKRFLRVCLDPKIYLAGLFSLVGFVAAHPYAVLHFRRFARSSALLIRIVHETEHYLRPIKPRTGLEYVQYNKYFLGLKNILTAEGLVFFVLIGLGIVWVLVRRNKSNAFLALSGLAYFLGALGFLGFSRYRDIPPLAVIYSFLGMLGLQALQRLFKNPGLKKFVSPTLVALVILSLEYSALIKTYYLWEDDTTEVAERWIRRNIPEGSIFGKEWFSPPTSGKDYSYPAFSAPFLYSRNFAPYERFNFIIISSAAYGHFFRNQKFYPDVIRIYKNVREKNELIKRFYFKDFEYKNPALNIFSTASQNRPRQRLSLPLVLPPDNPTREFEVSDGSPYGKDVCSFFLDGRQKVTRIIISPKKIREMAVLVTSLEGSGEVVVRSFLSKKRLHLETGQTAHLLARPRTSFPFFKHFYKISFTASRSLRKALVKLDYDEFRIGMEFFRQEDYETARRFFLRALENRPRNSLDLEAYLFLARCSERLGLHQESQKYLREALASPFIRRYAGLFQPFESDDSWTRTFEKMSGIDFELFEQTLTATIDDGDFKFSGGMSVAGPRFHRSTAFFMSGNQEGKLAEGMSPEIWALPQDYRLEFVFYNPSQIEGQVGELEIVSTNGENTERAVFPISLSPTGKEQVSSASFFGSAENLGKSNRFLIRIDPAKNLAFDCVKIIPDIRAFFNRKLPLIQNFLEGGKLTSSDRRE